MHIVPNNTEDDDPQKAYSPRIHQSKDLLSEKKSNRGNISQIYDKSEQRERS